MVYGHFCVKYPIFIYKYLHYSEIKHIFAVPLYRFQLFFEIAISEVGSFLRQPLLL